MTLLAVARQPAVGLPIKGRIVTETRNTVSKQTKSKPRSEPKASASPPRRTYCLSGLLMAVQSGDMTRAQAQAIASRWCKESQESLTKEAK
jgi:RNase P/RNase MRP subunit p29